jgi:hypothetical protein
LIAANSDKAQPFITAYFFEHWHYLKLAFLFFLYSKPALRGFPVPKFYFAAFTSNSLLLLLFIQQTAKNGVFTGMEERPGLYSLSLYQPFENTFHPTPISFCLLSE